ncbi:MAG: ferrochelatase [Acidobacteriota bacterium]
MSSYDALLVVSFGGPEGMDEVKPFLENVTRGKNVPRERIEEVARHYELFGGVSPANAQIRELIGALEAELGTHGPPLPVYWGNRNWRPMLADTLRRMAKDGIGKALAFITSAFSSYSGCRQYLEDIERARAEVGPEAPQVDRLRAFYNHPGFIEANIENTRTAFERVPAERREAGPLVFTAHSLPRSMAAGCDYEMQLLETCRLVAEGVHREGWRLAYQGRSGPRHQPWLEPDIRDCLGELGRRGVRDVVVLPVGFLSDHMEVVYDLDVEARGLADQMGLHLVRAATVGTHPRFVRMIRELVIERWTESPERVFLGVHGPSHDVCAEDCCLPAEPSPLPPRPG